MGQIREHISYEIEDVFSQGDIKNVLNFKQLFYLFFFRERLSHIYTQHIITKTQT